MLEYLIQLPCEVLGPSMLGFLELVDIILFENAAASHESQQLLRSILPYTPPILVAHKQHFGMHLDSINWFKKRRCQVQCLRINVELLSEVDLEHAFLDNIKLYLNKNTSLEHVEHLNKAYIHQRISMIRIHSAQDPAVMEVLFSLLSNTGSSVRSLDIGSYDLLFNTSNLSQWMEHIKKIGPFLRELTIRKCSITLNMLTTITEYCPYLEKLSLRFEHGVSVRNILQSIANNCPQLRSLDIENLDYNTSVEADADLTAFAEKCPQLEELSLDCRQFTDQSVIALAQHCSRSKKLKLFCFGFTATSLIELSERGLPLEELDIPSIPIHSAEIAAQCAHALSRIRELFRSNTSGPLNHLVYAIKYMTGLRKLYLDSPKDHLLVPELLLLLQGQCCAGLESLTVGSGSTITPQQLCELVQWHPQLQALRIDKSTCSSTSVLIELTRSCPHLQKVTLQSRKVLEEGVLALAAHCRQLRELDISETTVTEETVRKLAQHCRRLNTLDVGINRFEVNRICSLTLRALRETKVET